MGGRLLRTPCWRQGAARHGAPRTCCFEARALGHVAALACAPRAGQAAVGAWRPWLHACSTPAEGCGAQAPQPCVRSHRGRCAAAGPTPGAPRKRAASALRSQAARWGPCTPLPPLARRRLTSAAAPPWPRLQPGAQAAKPRRALPGGVVAWVHPTGSKRGKGPPCRAPAPAVLSFVPPAPGGGARTPANAAAARCRPAQKRRHRGRPWAPPRSPPYPPPPGAWLRPR